jgi:hypothetical protein
MQLNSKHSEQIFAKCPLIWIAIRSRGPFIKSRIEYLQKSPLVRAAPVPAVHRRPPPPLSSPFPFRPEARRPFLWSGSALPGDVHPSPLPPARRASAAAASPHRRLPGELGRGPRRPSPRGRQPKPSPAQAFSPKAMEEALAAAELSEI